MKKRKKTKRVVLYSWKENNMQLLNSKCFKQKGLEKYKLK
jgi:hypothetical protein